MSAYSFRPEIKTILSRSSDIPKPPALTSDYILFNPCSQIVKQNDDAKVWQDYVRNAIELKHATELEDINFYLRERAILQACQSIKARLQRLQRERTEAKKPALPTATATSTTGYVPQIIKFGRPGYEIRYWL